MTLIQAIAEELIEENDLDEALEEHEEELYWTPEQEAGWAFEEKVEMYRNEY